MKNTKRVFLVLMCVFMLAVSFCLYSCGDEDKTDAPQANEPGKVEVHEHDFRISVTKYPSVNEKGSKTVTCAAAGCNYYEVKEIEALAVSLPDITKLIAPIVENTAISAKIDDNSKIIIVKELDNYSTEEKGKKTFVTVELAEAMIKEQNDVLVGHVKFSFRAASVILDGTKAPADVAEPAKSDNLGALYLYVNGDSFALELDSLGVDGEKLQQKYNANAKELIVGTVASALGINQELVFAAANIGTELISYMPLVEGALTSVTALLTPDNLVGNIETLAALFGDALVGTMTDDNGNTVYFVDVEGVTEFAANYKTVTVKEFIDAQYGKGTTDAVIAFANGIFDMKLKDVAVKAIAFSKAYGVELETVFELINYVIYLASDIKIDIRDEIENRYENTLGEVVCELAAPGVSADEFVGAIKERMNAIIPQVIDLSLEQLYNLAAFGDPYFIPEGADEPYSIFDQLSALEGLADLSVTVNGEGELIALDAYVSSFSLEYVKNGDGVHQITVNVGGADIFVGELTANVLGYKVSGTLNLGNTYSLEAEVSGAGVSVHVNYNEYEVFVLEASTDENGLSNFDIGIYGFTSSSDPVTGQISENYEQFFELAIMRESNTSYWCVLRVDGIEAYGTVTLSNNGLQASITVDELLLRNRRTLCTINLIVTAEREGEVLKLLSFIFDVHTYEENGDADSTEIWFTASSNLFAAGIMVNEQVVPFQICLETYENGMLKSFNFNIASIKREYDPETDAVIGEEVVGVISITATGSENGKCEFNAVTEKYTITVEETVTENGIVGSLVICDRNTGKLLGEGTFKYEIEAENGVVKSVTFVENVSVTDENGNTATAEFYGFASENELAIYYELGGVRYFDLEIKLNELGLPEIFRFEVNALVAEKGAPGESAEYSIQNVFSVNFEAGSFKVKLPNKAEIVIEAAENTVKLQLNNYDKGDTLAELVINTEAGAVKNATLTVNGYVLDESEEGKSIFVNMFGASYETTADGALITLTDANGEEFGKIAFIVKGEKVGVDVLFADESKVYVDGAVFVTVSAADNKTSVRLDVDFDKFLFDEGDEYASQTPNGKYPSDEETEWNDVIARSDEYVIIDFGIIFTIENIA